MNKRFTWQRRAKAQGQFYLATGLWPLLHRKSFETVTGPKKDWWLVQTVGVLVTAMGSALLAAAQRAQPGMDTKILASGAAFGLAGMDAVHVFKRTMGPVYLADLVAELILFGAWSRVETVERGNRG